MTIPSESSRNKTLKRTGACWHAVVPRVIHSCAAGKSININRNNKVPYEKWKKKEKKEENQEMHVLNSLNKR